MQLLLLFFIVSYKNHIKIDILLVYKMLRSVLHSLILCKKSKSVTLASITTVFMEYYPPS